MVDYLARYWAKILFDYCGRAAQVSRLTVWVDKKSSILDMRRGALRLT